MMGNDGILVIFVHFGVIHPGSQSPATGGICLYVVFRGSK